MKKLISIETGCEKIIIVIAQLDMHTVRDTREHIIAMIVFLAGELERIDDQFGIKKNTVSKTGTGVSE